MLGLNFSILDLAKQAVPVLSLLTPIFEHPFFKNQGAKIADAILVHLFKTPAGHEPVNILAAVAAHPEAQQKISKILAAFDVLHELFTESFPEHDAPSDEKKVI